MTTYKDSSKVNLKWHPASNAQNYSTDRLEDAQKKSRAYSECY